MEQKRLENTTLGGSGIESVTLEQPLTLTNCATTITRLLFDTVALTLGDYCEKWSNKQIK